jgi:hypothetical protein
MWEMYLCMCARRAAIAQLGERQTEDLKVPGSIPGLGIFVIQPLAAYTWDSYFQHVVLFFWAPELSFYHPL